MHEVSSWWLLSNVKHFIFGLVILDCDFISVFGQESVLSGLNECRRGLSWEKPRRKNWLCKIQSFSEWLIFPLIRFKRSLFNCSIVDWISLKRWGVIQFLLFTYYNSSGLVVGPCCGMAWWWKCKTNLLFLTKSFNHWKRSWRGKPKCLLFKYDILHSLVTLLQTFFPPFNPNWLQLCFVLTWCIEIDEKIWWRWWLMVRLIGLSDLLANKFLWCIYKKCIVLVTLLMMKVALKCNFSFKYHKFMYWKWDRILRSVVLQSLHKNSFCLGVRLMRRKYGLKVSQDIFMYKENLTWSQNTCSKAIRL